MIHYGVAATSRDDGTVEIEWQREATPEAHEWPTDAAFQSRLADLLAGPGGALHLLDRTGLTKGISAVLSATKGDLMPNEQALICTWSPTAAATLGLIVVFPRIDFAGKTILSVIFSTDPLSDPLAEIQEVLSALDGARILGELTMVRDRLV